MAQCVESNIDPSFSQSLREESFLILLRTTEVVAVFSLAGILGFFVVLPSPWIATICSGALLIGCLIAELYRSRERYTASVVMYISALITAIIGSMFSQGVSENPFIFFMPLCISVAGLLLSPRAGAVVALLSTISYGIAVALLEDTQLLASAIFIVPAVLNGISAFIAWLSSHTFLTTVEWAMWSYRKVERREQQLYESEQRLQRAVQDKEYLNQQLRSSNGQLEQARAAAEDANRMKSQFVANISHELRTPLNAVIGFSYILEQELKGPLTEDQRDFLRRIYDSGQHLLSLLNDMLDTAKLEAGRIELHREPMHLEQTIHETLLTTTSLIRTKQIELQQAIAPYLPPVYGDQLRVAQVLLNLLSNAVKFTESGTITLRAYPVRAEQLVDGVRQTVQQVVVEVIDTGIGIAPEHTSMIFEEYRQADENLSRRYGGTGLGLPISRRLVELHGGTLTVYSVPGEGSTFRFTLPVATAEQLAATSQLSHERSFAA